jgi:thymidine phosphorylase
MDFLSLLEAKRDGQVLSAAQLREVVAACTTGQIPDYQLAAFLMAIYYRGLTQEETTALTLTRDRSSTNIPPAASAIKFRCPLFHSWPALVCAFR